VVSFTPRPRERAPDIRLDRRLGGPKNRSRRGGEEKNSQPLPGLEPPIIQPVALKLIKTMNLKCISLICPPVARTKCRILGTSANSFNYKAYTNTDHRHLTSPSKISFSLRKVEYLYVIQR